MGEFTVHHGDCLAILPTLPEASVDSIVTDPPYGLSFMGKEWDHGVPGEAFWREALRVAKPGAFLLAFGGTRTFHRLTCAIEDAGWQIRDCIMWVYGSGFPKGKACLKPAWEPIIVARRPGPMAPLRIDDCRIETEDSLNGGAYCGDGDRASMFGLGNTGKQFSQPSGRWPANLIHDGSEEVVGLMPVTAPAKAAARGGTNPNPMDWGNCRSDGDTVKGHNDSGGSAARFFYCAKASKRDRDGSPHPTMKPTDLMRYLCRLVTHPGGTVLDPFTGSGSTGKAAMLEGLNFIGCELSEEYVKIAEARIRAARLPLEEVA